MAVAGLIRHSCSVCVWHGATICHIYNQGNRRKNEHQLTQRRTCLRRPFGVTAKICGRRLRSPPHVSVCPVVLLPLQLLYRVGPSARTFLTQCCQQGKSCSDYPVALEFIRVIIPSTTKINAATPWINGSGSFLVMRSPNSTTGTLAIIMPSVVPATTT
jgi:hypothetical protein